MNKQADTELLDFLDSLPHDRFGWSVKADFGCVFVCRNSSDGHKDIRSAIRELMEKWKLEKG